MEFNDVRIFKNWWFLSVKGFIALILGIFAIAMPQKTPDIFIRYLGAVILVSGIMLLVGNIMHWKDNRRKFHWLAEASFDMLIGILIISKPEWFLTFVIFVLALWVLSVGLIQVVTSYYLRKWFQNWWTMLFSGMFTVLFALIIFLNPIGSSVVIAFLIGIFAIVIGLVSLKVARDMKNAQEE